MKIYLCGRLDRCRDTATWGTVSIAVSITWYFRHLAVTKCIQNKMQCIGYMVTHAPWWKTIGWFVLTFSCGLTGFRQSISDVCNMINTQTKRFLPSHTLCIAHLCTVVRMLMYFLHFLPCSFFLSALETFCERSTNVWKRLFQDSKRAVASKRNGELVVFFYFRQK